MKKTQSVLAFIILIALTNLSLAAPELEIKKMDRGSVVIAELNNPAVFDFIITNNGPADRFQMYSLVGMSMTPKGFFDLVNGDTMLKVMVWPSPELLQKRGFLSFEYQLKGQETGIFKDKLLIKIVPLAEALEISASPLSPTDTHATIRIKNKENVRIEKMEVNFASQFFLATEQISINPLEEINLSIPRLPNTEQLATGQYIFTGTIGIDKKEIVKEGIIRHLEKKSISLEKLSEGLIIKKTTITKTNQGNIPTTTSIEIKKDIVSRLFTLNSPEPETTERIGFIVRYAWKKDLAPGQSLVIESTTNYTFPLILVILIILIAIFTKIYFTTALILIKKVSFVKTKNGELALKISINAKARKNISRIQISDTLPRMAKLYEKFGKRPDTIDKATKKMVWNIGKITKGEERVFSYIIYSKMNIVGRFELPYATAIYELAEKTHRVNSNKTYFAREDTQ